MKKLIWMVIVVGLMAAVFAGCSGGGTLKAPSEKQEEPEQPKAEEPKVEEPKIDDAAEQPKEDEPAPAPTELIEPEQLISREEAAELLGEPVMLGDKTDNEVVGQKLACYEAEDDNSILFLEVSLQQQAYMPEGMTPKGMFDATIGAFEPEEVPDIGDEAYFATPGLHIMAHDYYILIASGNLDNEDVRARIKLAGTKAVANLEKLIGK